MTPLGAPPSLEHTNTHTHTKVSSAPDLIRTEPAAVASDSLPENVLKQGGGQRAVASDLLQVNKVSVQDHLLVQKLRPVWRHAVRFRHNKHLRGLLEAFTLNVVNKKTNQKYTALILACLWEHLQKLCPKSPNPSLFPTNTYKEFYEAS